MSNLERLVFSPYACCKRSARWGVRMVGRTVTRADLYAAAYQAAGASLREAEELVELVLAEIVGALARGEPVKLASFGTFTMRRKAGRVGRNPKTGEAAPISPRKVVVFRPSQVLKKRVRYRLAEKVAGLG